MRRKDDKHFCPDLPLNLKKLSNDVLHTESRVNPDLAFLDLSVIWTNFPKKEPRTNSTMHKLQLY